MAAFHPPGRGGRRAPTRLPGRVLLPVQPSPFTQPRTGLPASTPTRRRSRPGPLPAAGQTTPATQGAATAARSDRAPAQHRPPPPDPPPATLWPAQLRLSGEPQVDLPAPFGPRKPVTIPGRMVKVRSSTAFLGVVLNQVSASRVCRVWGATC